jgi:hypothetical protein
VEVRKSKLVKRKEDRGRRAGDKKIKRLEG